LTASGLVEIKIKKIKEGMNSGRLEEKNKLLFFVFVL
jgi:hypothetical protein